MIWGILKHPPLAWLLMFIAVLFLLGAVPYRFVTGNDGWVQRSFGLPGGWFGCDTYRSGKTEPPGQMVTRPYIADWGEFGVACGIAAVVPAVFLVTLWRRCRHEPEA